MFNAYMDIKSPSINVKVDHTKDSRCILVETTVEGDILTMHFENIIDAKAYHGLLGIALGVDK